MSTEGCFPKPAMIHLHTEELWGNFVLDVADAFMSRVFSGPCPLCLLLPQRYNISLWQAMNLIGSYSSLSGAAHQSYCLWVGVL